MLRGRRGSSVRTLIVAVAIVSSCFVAAILYFEASAVRARRQTDAALHNAMPSAEKLIVARTALRQLDGVLDRTVIDEMDGHPANVGSIQEARGRVDAAIAAYRSMPFYNEESVLNDALSAGLRELDQVLWRVTKLLSKKDLESLQRIENHEWRVASDRVDEALRLLTAFNVEHAVEHAVRIDQIWRRAAIVGAIVLVLSLLVALFATRTAARSVQARIRYEEERSAELEMFASRVAHDLMSPLGATSLAIGMLAKSANAAGEDWLRRSRASLKRVQQIVDGLFDFARSGGHVDTGGKVALSDVVRGVIDEIGPQAQALDIALASDVETAAEVEIRCSVGVLTVLLSNLLRNAIKFMGDSKDRRIDLRVRARAGCVRFEVEDSGPGLPADFVGRAFEPYTRAGATPGLGLGLATVKRLVDAHGGRVGVDASRTSGALVWFELPRFAA